MILVHLSTIAILSNVSWPFERDSNNVLRIGCPCPDRTHSFVVAGSIYHLVGALENRSASAGEIHHRNAAPAGTKCSNCVVSGGGGYGAGYRHHSEAVENLTLR